jgi:hypothetical protein
VEERGQCHITNKGVVLKTTRKTLLNSFSPSCFRIFQDISVRNQRLLIFRLRFRILVLESRGGIFDMAISGVPEPLISHKIEFNKIDT